MRIGMGGLLPDIPQDWDFVKLDDVAERATGHTPDKTIPSYWNGGIKWVSLADSNKLDQQYIAATDKEISAEGIRKSSAKLLPSGTVVLLRDAAVGRSTILATEMAVSQHFVAWICGNRICNRYLYFHFQFRKPFFERMAVGSTIVTIGMELFRKLMVPLPSIGEQEHIAVALETWDRSIELTERLIAAKQERRTWLMQQLLTGKHRAPGFSNKWTTRSMKELVEPVQRPIPKPSEAYKALGIRSHCKGTFERIINDPAAVDMDELFVAKAGDLIVNITFAWEGAIAFVPEEHDGNLVSHRFPTYRLKESVVDPEFMRYIVTQPRFRFNLVLISPGGAGRNRVMSKRDFLEIEVAVPCLEEQRKIGRMLKLADEEIVLLSQQLDALREQKKGLMQQLLTGKIRVKV